MTSGKPRVNWSGQVAFMLAASASAVGLGNLWRFPYLAAKYGGGTFLLIYLLLVVTFGFTLMITEVAIGRRTGLSALEAFRVLNKKFAFVGWLVTLIPAIILPYYCVIGGWVARYLHCYIKYYGSERMQELSSATFFSQFIADSHLPLEYGLLFVFLTFAVVVLGVKNGIERSNKIMMPLLLIMTIVVTGFSLAQPGALAGLKYYFKPDLSLFAPNREAFTTLMKTVVGAMGQMFYSLSLAMGIMITYGSYMRKGDSIEKSVRQIELVDTGVSILCGMMVIPAVFAFSGGNAEAINAGPGLMFITLPKVFAQMGAPGLVGILYFTLVLFAALTSAISLMETVVASIHDSLQINRIWASLITLMITAALAVPSALGYGLWGHVKIFRGMAFLDFFDFISNSIMMPIAAFLTCLFIGWIVGPALVINEAAGADGFRSKKLFVIMTKYVAPILLLMILYTSVLTSLGMIKI